MLWVEERRLHIWQRATGKKNPFKTQSNLHYRHIRHKILGLAPILLKKKNQDKGFPLISNTKTKMQDFTYIASFPSLIYSLLAASLVHIRPPHVRNLRRWSCIHLFWSLLFHPTLISFPKNSARNARFTGSNPKTLAAWRLEPAASR